jgi:hypothetical protein
LRQHGHHIDLGGIAAVSHDREHPHVLSSERGDDRGGAIRHGDVVID